MFVDRLSIRLFVLNNILNKYSAYLLINKVSGVNMIINTNSKRIVY